MIVVKLGGSSFDHSALREGLRAYLHSLAPEEVLLVVGGGELVEGVRRLDRLHGLGEEASHWLALEAMRVTAAFVARLIDVQSFGPRVRIADCLAFLEADEGNPGALPHSWDATSDSIAARLAIAHEAERVTLLKSIEVPLGTPWSEASERGWVDRYFPKAVEGTSLRIEVMNFRRYLESYRP